MEIASSRCSRVRAVEGAPTRDYTSRVHVGIGLMVTLPTLETFLRATIQLFDMATQRTFTRSISRVDGNDLDACQFRLVLNIAPKLTEAPTAQFSASGFLNPNPRTNALQIFEDNRPIRVFSLLDYFLADLVVEIRSIASLFSFAVSESPLRRFSLLRLKIASQSAMPLSQVSNLRAGETLPIGVGSNPSDAEIDAEKAVRIVIRRRLNHIDCREQKPFSISENKIGFALSRFKKLLLLLAGHKADLLTTGGRPDRNVIFAIPENAVIKSDGTVKPEDSLRLFIKFIGIGDFCDHSYGDLGGETELFTDFFVSELMQLKLTENLMFPRNTRALIGCLVSQAKRLFKRLRLRGIRSQFDSNGQFHVSNYTRLLFLIPIANQETIALSRAISNSSPTNSPKMANMVRVSFEERR